MKTWLQALFCFVILMVHGDRALAWPPAYGPEFTFTNSQLQAAQTEALSPWNPETLKKKNEFLDLLRRRCEVRKDCAISGARITYSDGWWFEVTTDPKVIEIKARKMPLSDIRRLKGRIQEDIFDVAEKSLGIRPNPEIGGGHISIDAESAFENDARRLRNVLVDFANHPELTSGVLYEENLVNAPSIGRLPRKLRDRFQTIIAEVDAGQITHADDLAEKLNREVFSLAGEDGVKYQAVTLEMMGHDIHPEKKRLQLRSVRAQRNAEEFLLEAELFEGRIGFLNRLEKPVPLLNLPIPETTTEMIQGFEQYVKEAKLSWKRFQVLLPRTWWTHPLLQKPCAVELLAPLLH